MSKIKIVETYLERYLKIIIVACFVFCSYYSNAQILPKITFNYEYGNRADKKIIYVTKTVLVDSLLVISGDTSKKENLEITIFPNPVSESLIIQFNTLPEESHTVTVFAASGSHYSDIVIREKINTIDVKAWKPGIYFLKVENMSKRAIYKIVKN